MEFKLTIADRMAILNILSGKPGSFVNLLLMKAVLEKVEFTPEEIMDFNIRSEGTRTLWDKEPEESFVLAITPREYDVLLAEIGTMDRNQQLVPAHLDTCVLLGYMGA